VLPACLAQAVFVYSCNLSCGKDAGYIEQLYYKSVVSTHSLKERR